MIRAGVGVESFIIAARINLEPYPRPMPTYYIAGRMWALWNKSIESNSYVLFKTNLVHKLLKLHTSQFLRT